MAPRMVRTGLDYAALPAVHAGLGHDAATVARIFEPLRDMEMAALEVINGEP